MFDRHHRKSIRLKEYDYSQPGEYFIIVCTHGHKHILGKIIDGEMQLSQLGNIVRDTWNDLPNYNHAIELDTFTIMPNHIHGIIIINYINVGAIHESPLQNILRSRNPKR
jgi:putative transposase